MTPSQKIVTVFMCVLVGVLVFVTTTQVDSVPTHAQLATMPIPTSTVVDDASILSSDTESSLRAEIGKVDKSIAEVGVLTIDTLKGMSIEEYGIKVGDSWRVGDKKLDNGIILIIAKNERQARIEVGSGAEACITDAKAGDILRTTLTPSFKAGKMDIGVSNTVHEIITIMTTCK